MRRQIGREARHRILENYNINTNAAAFARILRDFAAVEPKNNTRQYPAASIR